MRMTLADWVNREGGPKAVARRLRVSEETVLYWLKRRGYPKVNTIAKILNLANGDLTFQDIFHSTCPKPNGRVQRQ